MNKTAASCKTCELGSVQIYSLAIRYQCIVCLAGKYYTNASTRCEICGGGKYQDQNHGNTTNTCKNCPVGRYLVDPAMDAKEHDEQQDCLYCLPGPEIINDTTFCSGCQNGKYQDQRNSTLLPVTCKFCHAGTAFQSTTKNCLDCIRGRYQDRNDEPSATCRFCEAGKVPNTTSTPCVKCPEGWLALPRSFACLECLP